MSRIISSRLAWVVAALAVVITGGFVVQDVVAGPEDRDLGPVVENTHRACSHANPNSNSVRDTFAFGFTRTRP